VRLKNCIILIFILLSPLSAFAQISFPNEIFIFKKNGDFLLRIEVDGQILQDKVTGRFSVDGEGNIYALIIGADDEVYNLSRIKRNW
jgi:hypothetical protein